MPFKASKKRERKPADPIGRGKPIVPSVAMEKWYRDQLSAIIEAMIQDYKGEIESLLKKTEVKEFYAEDAAISSLFKRLFKRLSNKWQDVFRGFAKKTAESFVDKTEKQATQSTIFSLKVAGIKEPTTQYNENIRQTIQAEKDFNFTLITNLNEEAHNKIYNAVMLSLTSPNPEQQGEKAIIKALGEVGIKSKKRAALIARDQTSKLYSSLSDERMMQNGVEEFEWMHSSAGKTPRHTHLEKDGQIFKINDPRLWTGPKNDQGPPGWAINCRCRKRPIIT